MSFKVIEAHARDIKGVGEGLGCFDTYKEASHEARSTCDADALKILQRAACGGQRVIDDLINGEHMVARCELGDDAAKASVDGDLAGDGIGEDRVAVLDDRGACFIAAGFKSHDEHVGPRGVLGDVR